MEGGPQSRRLAALAAALIAVALPTGLPHAARASAPPAPWDGSNPFQCTVQDAGTGTSVPDPGADPYCVHFDKTHQNVLQGGLVDFLEREPARTAAAVPKCFYFQEDHWRGSLVQGDTTAIYEFEGHYFFDKATGDGGVWVTGFQVEGQTLDPTSLPGFPPQYGGYFGPGTGGFITHDQVPVDPQCAAQAKDRPPASSGTPGPRCVPDTGDIDRRRLGPVALGARENTIRAELGDPGQVKRGFLHYCVTGGGSLLVGQPGDRSGSFGTAGRAPAIVLLTTARGFSARGIRARAVAVGSARSAVRAAFPHARALTPAGGLRIVTLAPGLLAVERRGRVAMIGSYAPRAIRTRSALAGFVARAR